MIYEQIIINFALTNPSEEVNKYFFKINPGLSRRFPFQYNIEKYTADDLKNIFIKKIALLIIKKTLSGYINFKNKLLILKFIRIN